MPDLLVSTEVAARVVIDGDSEVNSTLKILLDRGDCGKLAVEYHVHDIGTTTGPEANAVTRSHGHTTNDNLGGTG